MSRIAVIAGKGSLPAALVPRLNQPLICSLNGFAPEGLNVDLCFIPERSVSFIKELQSRDVSHLIFAGAVHRPKLNMMRLDMGTLMLIPRVLRAMKRGDDGTLRELISYVEEKGFYVMGVGDVAPELLPQAGVVAGKLTKQIKEDAKRAAEIVAALGMVDVGQGCVVERGRCLALEVLSGTDAMLESVVSVPEHLRSNPARARGVFYKAPKPNQDMRIDLPTLGPNTIHLAARAGLGAVVWQAGGVICLDIDEMTRLANEYGITLWAR